MRPRGCADRKEDDDAARLPLAYNKDMQEDKEGLFDASDTWLDCPHMAALVLDGIQGKTSGKAK